MSLWERWLQSLDTSQEMAGVLVSGLEGGGDQGVSTYS